MTEHTDDLFPLSWISQYGFCPRRCGLMAIDQAWEENAYTTAGAIKHERVHTYGIERRGTLAIVYEMPVFSHALGVTGKCDCVELQLSEQGITVPFCKGTYNLYPIEYKHGVVRDEVEYKMQLCAQAMCIEQMYGCHIDEGAIYYIDSHRRDPAVLNNDLRTLTINTAKAIQEMVAKQVVPKGSYGPKCKKCSLLEYCEPSFDSSTKQYYSQIWGIAFDEVE